MVLTFPGLRHLALSLQTNVLFDQENQYTLWLTLGTQLQYTSFHEQYYTTVTCVVGKKVALLSAAWCAVQA